MRFLLSFFLAIIVVAGLITAFVVPPDQLRGLMAKMPTEWFSTPSFDFIGGDEQPETSAGISGQSLPAASTQYESIRKAEGDPVGDWLYNCEPSGEGGQNLCVIAHQLTDRTNGKVIFSWLIGTDANDRFQAVWQTPTGILVNRGVVIDAGTEKPITLPYTACVAGFCEAVANLAPDFIDILLKTDKATASIVTVSGQTVTFPISTDGLADGITALKYKK